MSIFSYNIVNQCIFISQGVELLLSTFLSGKINRLFVRKMSISYQNRESRSWYPQWALFIWGSMFKGNVREKWKRTKVKVEKYSMVIAYILTSICLSKSRKLLKKTHTEEGSVHINSEACNIWLGS